MPQAISFVVAAYNRSPYLSSCITSLVNQTIPSQVMISTGTPNDHIYSVASSFGLPVLINNDSGNIGRDWNFALQQGDHPIVVIAHQDDIYNATFAEEILKHWHRRPGWLMAFTDHAELLINHPRLESINLKIKRALINRAFRGDSFQSCSDEFRRKLFGWGNPICCPSVALNRDELRDFRFSEDWTINLDWEGWSRICEMKGHLAYINQKLMFHRIHPDSETSVGLRDERRSAEDARMFAKFWPRPIRDIIIAAYATSYISNHISS